MVYIWWPWVCLCVVLFMVCIWWAFFAPLEWCQLDYGILFNVLLSAVCLCSVDDFCIYVCQWGLPVVVCLVVSWFSFDITLIVALWNGFTHFLIYWIVGGELVLVSFNGLINFNNKSGLTLSLLEDFISCQVHYLLLICLNFKFLVQFWGLYVSIHLSVS